MHEKPVARNERIRRLARLRRFKIWRSLLLGITDPVNDSYWAFIVKRGTSRYLDDPEPWFAPGAVQFLAKRLRPGARAFEWGAGSSTLWLISYGCNVVSYETDIGWIRALTPHTRELADIHHIASDDSGYCTASLEGFDVVLIDGRRRLDCALHTAEYGKSGLLVVFDDSHREVYHEGEQALSQRAANEWHFPGLSKMLTPKMTSLFELR